MAIPIHIDGEELPVPHRAPTVGEHSDEVLRRVLGYDDDHIKQVRATGALG
jgi:crotonobetainyl-CoA:carnitine CoA-transferase CaiB-like acyl-CoA transferase